MYSTTYRYVAVFAALAIFAAAVYLFLTTTAAPTRILAQDNNDREHGSTSATSASTILSALLESDGVSVRDADLLPARVRESRTVLIRLDSETNGLSMDRLVAEMPSASSLSIMNAQSEQGPLTRQRSLDLSPNQILAVAFDRNKRALWWSLHPDPRIVHAETSDGDGNLSGQTVYKTTADMLVSFPDVEEIVELRFYHPKWNGRSHELRWIGSVATLLSK